MSKEFPYRKGGPAPQGGRSRRRDGSSLAPLLQGARAAWGFRVLGFQGVRVLGFQGVGFQGFGFLGFRVLGFGFLGLGSLAARSHALCDPRPRPQGTLLLYPRLAALVPVVISVRVQEVCKGRSLVDVTGRHCSDRSAMTYHAVRSRAGWAGGARRRRRAGSYNIA